MKNIFLAFVLAAIPGFLALRAYAWQNPKPLKEADLIYLLKNDVPASRVAELAQNKGIDFELTPKTEKELRQAGADASLIATLRKLAPKPSPAAPAPAPAATSAARAESVAKLAAGTVRISPKDGQRYVWIPPGSFTMGCSPGDSECFDEEKPPHQVTLTKGFWIGQTAVTVGAWKRYRIATGTTALPTADGLGEKNWNEAGDENMPAGMMTWDEAKSFCEWAAMRLPTEAEWEYAARAGTTAARYGDLDSIAWYGDNSGNQRIDSTALWKQDAKTYAQKLFENGNFVHGVGLKQPNAWKLYGMLGNVYDWTADWYDAGYYAKSETQDPLGPPGGQFRVGRGGSWLSYPQIVRFSYRYRGAPGYGDPVIGCRCVGELP